MNIITNPVLLITTNLTIEREVARINSEKRNIIKISGSIKIITCLSESVLYWDPTQANTDCKEKCCLVTDFINDCNSISAFLFRLAHYLPHPFAEWDSTMLYSVCLQTVITDTQ